MRLSFLYFQSMSDQKFEEQARIKKMRKDFQSVANNAVMKLWIRSNNPDRQKTKEDDEPFIDALVDNRYRIKKYIANGSFGHTWVAEDTLRGAPTAPVVCCLKTPRARHDMNCKLADALKEIREELAASRMLMGLKQPRGMVNVLDVSPKGQPAPIVTRANVIGNIHFIVQEFCEAGDFHGFTQRGLDESEAKELGKEVSSRKYYIELDCRFI